MLRSIVIAIALVACSDPDIAKVKAVRDRVCACKSPECGEEAMKTLPAQEGKPSHRVRQLASEMMTCMSKLYLKDKPDEDPDAPTPSGIGSGSAP